MWARREEQICFCLLTQPSLEKGFADDDDDRALSVQEGFFLPPHTQQKSFLRLPSLHWRKASLTTTTTAPCRFRRVSSCPRTPNRNPSFAYPAFIGERLR